MTTGQLRTWIATISKVDVRRCSLIAHFSAVILLPIFFVACSDTLSNAIQIGGDEGWELSKARLWANGYDMYTHVWNNQPPLYTTILGLAFRCFGDTIVVARCVAIAFGILFVLGTFAVVRHASGVVAAYSAAVCLMFAPLVLELSISAMLEVPAIAVALWALHLAQRFAVSRETRDLILSGALMAVALELKLTAVIVVPAVLVEVARSSRGESLRNVAFTALRSALLLAVATVSFFATLTFVLGGDYDQMWASHFSSQAGQYLEARSDLTLSWNVFSRHYEVLVGATVALLWLATNGGWGQTLAPISLLLTVTAVHLLRHPWWEYYYIHFAVPLCWLSGYAVAALSYSIQQTRKAIGRGERYTRAGLFLVLVSLGSLFVVVGGSRITSSMERIRALPRTTQSELIRSMRQHSAHTRWAYTLDPIYAFHANIMVLPELAVLSPNRFWSGRITDDYVWSTIMKCKPEQLLLIEGLRACAERYVEANYVRAYEIGGHRLYVLASLAPEK